MEFGHQKCAKDGIMGWPPYQHIQYLILEPLHVVSNLLDSPTNPLDSRNKGFFTLLSGLAFEQMEFWHQKCAKDGIIGSPPY